MLGEDHGFIWGRSSLRRLLDFQVETRSKPGLYIQKRWGEDEEVMRETRGLEEGVLALLVGQVRGRVSTDLEIWVMGSSPTAASAQGLV